MEFRASHRYAHISAKKVRLTANLIRGLNVNRALEVLSVTTTRGSSMFNKVLRSAVANASQNDGVDVNSLFVSEARVDEGPLIHGRARFRPGAMGRAMPIRRRTSHLKLTVTEREAN
ncbi:MAG: 50S ribosomal protein L22 [Planctomycetota bacterium]|jgi:large subunit ribosomal protein L22|nr:50S ribosomal protein L22 [Planctomycetota bacterium]